MNTKHASSKLRAGLLAALAVALVALSAVHADGDADGRKRQVTALLKSIETGDPERVGVINAQKYIQHNLAIGDGLAGLAAALKQLPPRSARVKTIRVFRDGDFVFAHTEYNFFGPKVGFDVFRFEDGKIVEHWDNLSEKDMAPNRGGHTQTDGPTEARDLEKTEANKSLVRNFFEDILIHGRKDKIAVYLAGNKYIQHSPRLGDGGAGLQRMAESVASPRSPVKFDKIHHLLGEGNFVLVMSEGTFRSRHTAFYDLFRVEDGKVVEHWDTIEAIPAKSEWKNENGKF